MSDSPTTRVTYAEAGAAHREVVARACQLNLSRRQWKVLSAVIARTASWSKLGDRLYLGQLASVVYGVERATRAQRDNVGRELTVLANERLIWRRAPKKGRPEAGSAPAYLIALRPDVQLVMPDDWTGWWDDNASEPNSISPHGLLAQARNAVGSDSGMLSGSGDLTSSTYEENTVREGEAVPLALVGSARREQDEEAFQRFWTAYPKKRNRKVARAAFLAAIKQTEPDPVIEGAERYARECSALGTEKRWIADPARWLDDERWTDEPMQITTVDAGNGWHDPTWDTGPEQWAS